MSVFQSGGDRHMKPNPTLKILGTVIFILGLAFLFMPAIVHQIFPYSTARALIDYAKPLIVIGIGLHIVASILATSTSGGRVTPKQQNLDGQSNEEGNIDWSPAKPGGASFKSHQLVTVSADRVEVRPSKKMFLFCLVLMAMGAGVTGKFLLAGIRQGDLTSTLMQTLIGMLFVVMGGLILLTSSKRGVFDLSLGGYWRGANHLNSPQALTEQPEWAWLQEIKALQLVGELVARNRKDEGRRRYFVSYELNLVLGDGSRINVMDHSDRNQLRQDAETLGQFLGVPVLERS